MSKVRRRGSVIPYARADGQSAYRIRYRDANGDRQIETLPLGASERDAEDLLADRLSAVRTQGYVPPSRSTFETAALEWRESLAGKQLKRSTRGSYKSIVDNHLIPKFGSMPLARVDVAAVERVIAEWLEAGASAGSCNRRLNVLSLVMKSAVKRKLIAGSPMEAVDRPRERRQSWRILTPQEVGRVVRAFGDLIAEAEGAARDDLATARVMFVTLIDSAVRRGELLGLRWCHVQLANPDGPTITIEETWVRNADDSPKSDASKRSIPLSNYCAEELTQHLERTRFGADEDRVFCNPRRGSAFDVHVYATLSRKALKRADIPERERIRAFHDQRHSSLTNGALAGMTSHALQARAGHSSYATTQRYVQLAGVEFAEENAKLGARLWGAKQET
jgi:integrase